LIFSLKYAAPEVVAACEADAHSIVATSAVDVWALGVIAFEMLTRCHAFSYPFSQSLRDVFDCLMGRALLPWEAAAPGGTERAAQMGLLRRTVLACLARDPAARPSTRDVLASWISLLERTTGESVQEFGVGA
jgi:serine/threonine protein kinase